MKQPTVAVANYFLEKAKQDGDGLSPMKLQKLIYFAHGWHLAIHDEPLIDEQIQAWSFGPVIPTVYSAVKHHGNAAVQGRLVESHDGIKFLPTVKDPETRELLDKIWSTYGKFTAVQLSNMTHEAGTPWDQLREKYEGQIPRGTDISDESIRQYFVRAPARS